MTTELTTRPEVNWEAVKLAFYAEKRNHTGSDATVWTYGSVLDNFFKLLDERGIDARDVDQAVVHTFCNTPGPHGGNSLSTISVRLSALRSFYGFLVRMKRMSSNPCEGVKLPVTELGPARGLSVEEYKRLLAACPDTCAGQRDKAIITFLAWTGRRVNEVMQLRGSDITQGDEGDDKLYYTYRGKGNKVRTRELVPPVVKAIEVSLAACGREPDLGLFQTQTPDELLFGQSNIAFYFALKRHLRKAGLPEDGTHLLRHTAAKLRRKAGASIEQIRDFLDHADLATTSLYLDRLEGTQDPGWKAVAQLLHGDEA